MKQRKIHCSIGFVEVKPDKSECAKHHENMIRLTAFCKDALELRNSDAMIAVQVIGKSSRVDEKGVEAFLIFLHFSF